MRHQEATMSGSQTGSLQFDIVKGSITPVQDYCFMVLSMVDQHKPKCYICSSVFEDLEKLRIHQEVDHKEFVEFHKDVNDHSPAPGDVTVF